MLMYVQMVLDNVTNSVYSNEKVTLGNSGFKQDLILSPTADYLYTVTDQQVHDKHHFLIDVLIQ